MYIWCMTGPVTYSNEMHVYSFSEKEAGAWTRSSAARVAGIVMHIQIHCWTWLP